MEIIGSLFLAMQQLEKIKDGDGDGQQLEKIKDGDGDGDGNFESV